MRDHTAHTLDHMPFRRKCGACRVVSEHARVSGFEHAFGRYRIRRRLDKLEVGQPHPATLVGVDDFEKPVMIWRIGDADGQDSETSDAAMLEVQHSASLSHANIAQVLDVGVAHETRFVATEYVGGQTLQDILRVRKQLPWCTAAYIAGEVAAGLSYAHSRRARNGELLRLVHRRLTPRRIMLSVAGDVKIIGFGISWAWPPADDDDRSPEDTRGEPLDGRADVFALGAVLRGCIRHAEVPVALRDLIKRMLQPHPEQRPTAAEARWELVRILHAARRPPGPRAVAELAVTTAPRLDSIERIERRLDSMTVDSVDHARTILGVYERYGQLCLDAHLGERATTHMVRALDLADGLGRDDYAARFCALRGQLLAQANRADESRDWLERAASLLG